MNLVNLVSTHRVLSGVIAATVAATTVTAVVALDSGPAAAADCSDLASPVYQRINSTTQAALLTASASEATRAGSTYGFDVDRGVLLLAGSSPAAGLVATHRLYQPTSSDFVFLTREGEIANAVQKLGYVDQGENFYVAATARSCTVAVHRFRLLDKHRYAVGDAERVALAGAGWTDEGVVFHASAPKGAGTPSTPPAPPKPSVKPTSTSPTAAPTASPVTPRPSTPKPTTPKPTTTTPVAGKPNASNTGIPAGVTLTQYTGPLTITTDGTVIDGKHVYGDLLIRAKNVTIRNSYLHGGQGHPGSNTGLVNANHESVSNLVVERSLLKPDSPSYFRDGIVGHDYTARGNHITNTNDGLGIFNRPGGSGNANVTATGNYIHDQTYWISDPAHSDGTHNDGIQVQGGANVYIAGNTVVASVVPGDGLGKAGRHGSNGILLQQNTGRISNAIVENNWVDDGNSTITIVAKKLDSITVTVRGNLLGRNQFVYAGNSTYQIRIHDQAHSTVIGLATNKWADTGQPLTASKTGGIRFGG